MSRPKLCKACIYFCDLRWPVMRVICIRTKESKEIKNPREAVACEHFKNISPVFCRR